MSNLRELESLEVENFQTKLGILRDLIKSREKADLDLDQNYVTEDSIIRRLQVIGDLINGQRVLAIGDGDLTATSIAIFGNPSEVVVTDIDRRLTDLLFEVNMEYDLPVRFVYHDMRIKIIEILLNQYTMIIMEPPHSKAGITVFLSRAMQCIQAGYQDRVFVSVMSSGPIRSFFNEFCKIHNIKILERHPKINEYLENREKSDFLRIEFPIYTKPIVKNHWIEPFYSYEENSHIKEYRCICHEIIEVGPGKEYKSIDELKTWGHSCGHKDVFAFHSKIKLL